MTAPEIRTHRSPDLLAEAVATALTELLVAAQAEDRVPSIALTGGTIAVTVHEAVVTASAGKVDWSRVDIWWGDERFVPASDQDRNAQQARDSLLDRVDVDPARVHEMPASDGDHGALDAAATAYGDELRSQGNGVFDVVMLGLGPDGHVASLFPGFAQLDVEDAVAVPVRDSPKPPPDRISLTYPALNRNRQVWFLVSGEGKAEAVAKTLAADGDLHDTPARGVLGQEQTIWFLDEDAASAL